jgi:putative cardiolipin synthase
MRRPTSIAPNVYQARRPRHGTIATALIALLLSACSTVSLDYPKDASDAIPTSSDTRLGQVSHAWQQMHGDKSGFLALTDGNEALGMRLKLIEAAEASVDAQYFLMKRDTAAGLFLGKLLRAADRGVRVRLLIDDIFTPNLDAQLNLFNSHPNIEVRLFNPVSRRGWKYWNYITNFKRANRRMHNKSFTVDNSFTIVGGRNIADEYFQIKEDLEFLDAEILGIGKVAEDVAQTFDLFWNSSLALPIEAFETNDNTLTLDQWRSHMEFEIEQAKGGIYARAVASQLLQDIAADQAQPVAALALVVSDDPKKLKNTAGINAFQALAEELGQRFESAQHEIVIVTPYFVPRKGGLEFLQAQRARGIRVRVITNSLASTNHVAVHSGYARYRKEMLKIGVELYEVKPHPANFDPENTATAIAQTLHTKLAIVDGEVLFMGSLNFDPRSIDINTEMGIFIESATIAQAAMNMLTQNIDDWTYKLMLSANGSIKWIDRRGSIVEILKKEPLSPWGRRFSADFYGILPIEGQL